MKKIGLFLFICLSSLMFSQKDEFSFRILCYQHGDTIPNGMLEKLQDIYILNNQRPTDTCNVLFWKLSVFYKNAETVSFNSSKTDASLLTSVIKSAIRGIPDNLPTKILFENIKIEHTDTNGDYATTLIDNVVFYRAETSGKNCTEQKTAINHVVTYKAKLLMGEMDKVPLINQSVLLMDSESHVVQNTITNEYGDFHFENLNAQNYYNIEVPADDSKIKDGQLFIANTKGQIINSFKKAGKTFVYELLPIELTKLTDLKEDEVELTLKELKFPQNKELKVVKDVYFKVNSAELNPDDKDVLNDVLANMKQDASLFLTIISHTDAQGNDEANLLLSEKRAKNVLLYFVNWGIDRDRLDAKGLGESQILNHCKNGIMCSEQEHQVNRRTEFIFTHR